MGTFITQMVCKSDSREAVIDALVSIQKRRGFNLGSRETISTTKALVNEFDITGVKNQWVQVFCPEKTDEALPKELSRELNTQVFLYHIHDGDLWMYLFFVSGELKDKYNPLPDYWGDVSEEERIKWKGNSDILAQTLHVDKSQIEPYLIFWKEEPKRIKKKTFPGDEFTLGSDWAMIDFQRKLGIEYPDFENPKAIDMVRLTFRPGTVQRLFGFFRKGA